VSRCWYKEAGENIAALAVGNGNSQPRSSFSSRSSAGLRGPRVVSLTSYTRHNVGAHVPQTQFVFVAGNHAGAQADGIAGIEAPYVPRPSSPKLEFDPIYQATFPRLDSASASSRLPQACLCLRRRAHTHSRRPASLDGCYSACGLPRFAGADLLATSDPGPADFEFTRHFRPIGSRAPGALPGVCAAGLKREGRRIVACLRCRPPRAAP